MPSVENYVKNPVTIRAIQYDGTNVEQIQEIFGASNIVGLPNEDERPFIYTLEGRMYFDPDDFIIEGVAGELYPCKDNIFRVTYTKKGG